MPSTDMFAYQELALYISTVAGLRDCGFEEDIVVSCFVILNSPSVRILVIVSLISLY